jgi:hypothetical protein
VIRYRTKIVQQRVSEIARLGNALQDAPEAIVGDL